ncbi:MAG: hypothetical protein WKF96_13610, partial [Solirubrobacteraceae bacterium]
MDDDEAIGLNGLQVAFDDERVVSDAGVMLVAALAQRPGIEALAGGLVRLRRDRPGAANFGRKVMALLFAMVLGADSIDDADGLRAGRTRRLLGAGSGAGSCGQVRRGPSRACGRAAGDHRGAGGRSDRRGRHRAVSGDPAVGGARGAG